MNRLSHSTKNGFTIVELVVVIAVIAVLTGIAVLSYGAWRKSALETQVKSDLNAAAGEMESARNFGDGYPANASAVENTIMIGGGSSDGSTYCVDGISVHDDTIKFYIDSTIASTIGAQPGTCADRTDVSPPDVPENLALVQSTQTSLLMSWSAANYAGSYTLQCATDLAYIINVVSETVNDTSAMVSNLLPLTTYHCHVRSINNAGSSAWSGSVTVDTKIESPSAPEGLTASSDSTSQITVSWPEVGLAESYTLEYATNSSFSGKQVISGITDTSREVTGLAAETTYYFRLIAVNDGGPSGTSAAISETTQSPAPSGTPTIAAAVDSPTQITIAWTAIGGATSYRVEYSTNSDFSSSTSISGITSTSQEISGLSQGARYYIRAYASSGIEVGPGNTVNPITTISTPAAPSVSVSYPGGAQNAGTGKWAKTYDGDPTSGNYYYNRASLSGSSCASGTTRYFRARMQYSSPSTWGPWTSYGTTSTIVAINVNSPWGIRFQVQSQCRTSLISSSTSSSGYGCYWPGKSGSARTSCSGF